MAEPKGVCLSCGSNELVVRYSKRGLPFCKCLICGTKIFARGNDGALKWMARAIDDAKTGSYRKAVSEGVPQIVAWMQKITQGAPLPGKQEKTLEEQLHEQMEKQRAGT